MLSIKTENKKPRKWTGRPRTSEELFVATLKRKQPMAYDEKKRACFYDKEVNGGCVIGMWLGKSVELEAVESVSACDLDDKYLPKKWVENKIPKDYLEGLQEIHDDRKCWENHVTGKLNQYGVVWSKLGIKKLSDLIKEYKLDIKIKDELTKTKKAVK